jgi:hypothetical protein
VRKRHAIFPPASSTKASRRRKSLADESGFFGATDGRGQYGRPRAASLRCADALQKKLPN